MNPDVNIANRPPAERLAIHADLLAHRLIDNREEKGRPWVEAELAKLKPDLMLLVKELLNARIKQAVRARAAKGRSAQ